MARPLLLLDSASLYYRAYFGVPESMVAPNGMPINAVRGFLDMIGRLVVARKPRGVVACWDDDWRPAWRVEAIPTYKTHRVIAENPDASAAAGAALSGWVEDTPDTLSPQVPIILSALEALGIPVIGAAHHEADDVIGTLATREPGPVEIVTGDRDLFQLVTPDRSVIVLYTAGGVRELIEVDCDWVANKYGIPGEAYADFALLRGDSSDGLPGVKGIGEKSAAALLNLYGSVPRAYEVLAETGKLDGLPPATARKLTEGMEYVIAAAPVVRVVRDLEVPALPALAAPDDEALELLAEDFGLRSSIARARDAVGRMQA